MIITQYSNLTPDEFRSLCERELPSSCPLAQEIVNRLNNEEEVGQRLEDMVTADNIEIAIRKCLPSFLREVDQTLGLDGRLDFVEDDRRFKRKSEKERKEEKSDKEYNANVA